MNIALTALRSVAKLVGLAQSTALQTSWQYKGHVAASPVALQLFTADNLADGMLTYTRSGIAIQVVGTLHESSLLLHEFDKKGTVVGIYSGEKTRKGFSGTWHSPSSSGKEMPFELSLEGNQSPLTPLLLPDLTGTYEYNFGPKARAATLLVQQVDAQKIWVSLQGVTGEPVRLSAFVDTTSLRLTGNQAIYSSADSGNCPTRLTFFDRGASVELLDPSRTHESLAAATITGYYIRTDADIPFFRQLN